MLWEWLSSHPENERKHYAFMVQICCQPLLHRQVTRLSFIALVSLPKCVWYLTNSPYCINESHRVRACHLFFLIFGDLKLGEDGCLPNTRCALSQLRGKHHSANNILSLCITTGQASIAYRKQLPPQWMVVSYNKLVGRKTHLSLKRNAEYLSGTWNKNPHSQLRATSSNDSCWQLEGRTVRPT